MVRIKPWRAQGITERCYFHLLLLLCHSVTSVFFRKPYFGNIKSLRGFGHRNADTKDPGLFVGNPCE